MFLFDNLLYPNASGNGIMDWGGLLLRDGILELNIFSGATGDQYFYFADNGQNFGNFKIIANDPTSGNQINAPGTLTYVNGDPYSPVPEPGSLFSLGTGLLGLAFLLFRKAAKTPMQPGLGA